MNKSMQSDRTFLPYALPEIGDEEIAEVIDSLKSGWITTGPKAKRFEQDFITFLGDQSLQAISVNSATAGLHIALEAVGIGPGDEVITTTLTFTATAEVARYLGADVRLVDIDPVTLNIDTDKLEAAITPHTKAILPVHYGGLPCNMDPVIRIARKHGLRVVEDAAHALPSLHNGHLIGTLDTDATVFSFYANKTMTTGEGGMVVTRNKEMADRMRIMRLHGISRDAFDRFMSKTPAWYYEIVAPGFKYNLTDIAAAMGIHQLKRLQGFWKRRQYLAERYFSALKDLPYILPAAAPDNCQHSWHLFVLRLPEGTVGRDHVINHLSEQGIGTSVHYLPLHRQPYWRDRYQLTNDMFPLADQAYQTMLSIPLYTAMTDLDQDRVVQALTTALE